MTQINKHLVGLSIAVLALLGSACGSTLEGRLAPDPELQERDRLDSEPSTPEMPTATLPPNFPEAIPIYPRGELIAETASEEGGELRWRSQEAIAPIAEYYRSQFEAPPWEIVSESRDEEDGTQTLTARGNNLQVRASFVPRSGGSEFTLNYRELSDNSNPVGDRGSRSPDASPQQETPLNNLDEVSGALRPLVEDVAALGVLSVARENQKEATESAPFDPNGAISRRHFARWLVSAYNRFYADLPSRQIRLANGSGNAAFQDVPPSDPDYGAIQGLAEAGIIPSRLSDESAPVLFRPDAALTRENLIDWKVALDQQNFPNASVEDIKETWGFQDASKIDPSAIDAVLADYNSGDRSNIRRVYGLTRLFQPEKAVTQAEAAAALWYFGSQNEGRSAREVSQIDSSNS